MCAQRFGDARGFGFGQSRDGDGDDDGKGLRGEKLDLDAIEQDVRDARKQLELCSVAAKEDGLESGEQPNGPKCASASLPLPRCYCYCCASLAPLINLLFSYSILLVPLYGSLRCRDHVVHNVQ